MSADISGLYPTELSPSPGGPRPGVTPARFGRREVRFRAPGRSVEIAPVAGGFGVTSVVRRVVVVELALSLLCDHSKEAEV